MSHANSLEIVAVFPNAIAHSWTGDGLLCSRGNEIFIVPDLAKPEPVVVGRIPWSPWQNVARLRLVDRVAKLSILQVLATPHGFLVSTGHSWWCVNGEGSRPIERFSDTRPMDRGMCTSTNGDVYVADYTLNPERRPVRIFRSSNLRSFEIAWEFQSGSVRHVHALVPDPDLEERIWVLTGDRDAECGIHFTDDAFETLQSFSRSGQKSRATDLVFHDGNLIWGMDSPDETPFVVRAPRGYPELLECVCELPGPAYYMTQNQSGGIYVGTTAEPGRAVRDRRAHAFRIAPEGTVEEVLSYERDWLPQHGILSFPRGVLPGSSLAFGLRALKPNEGCLILARDRYWG